MQSGAAARCIPLHPAQRRDKPIDPARRYEFPGFSLQAPQAGRWVIAKVAPVEVAPPGEVLLVPQTAAMLFERRGAELPRSQTIGVGTRDLGEGAVKTPQEYLAYERKRMIALGGTQLRAGLRVVSSSFELDGSLNDCLRFEQVTEDTTVPRFAGIPILTRIRGYRCLHPRYPRYAVSIAISERYQRGEQPEALDAEIEPCLRSLQLTQERPVFVTPIEVGLGAQGVAVQNGTVWVAWGDAGAARIDARTREVTQLRVGRDPIGIAAGAEGVWVVNRRDGTVAPVDPASNQMGNAVMVGRAPLTIATGAGAVWVADEGSSVIVRVDPATGRPSARIEVGRRPSGLVATDQAIYATSFDQDRVVKIDPATNRIIASQSLRGIAAKLLPGFSSVAPGALALGSGSLWAACQGDGSVVRLDPGDLHVMARIDLGTRPSGIATGGGAVWVTLYDEDAVQRIDPRTNRVTSEPIPVGARPVLAAFGDGALWVTNAFSKSVSRVDP